MTNKYRPKRVDKNQKEIVKALRAAGFSVLHLHEVGKGCPDILVGKCGINLLIEIKNGDKPPSARKLTDQQVAFHDGWRGTVIIALNIEEAVIKASEYVSRWGF